MDALAYIRRRLSEGESAESVYEAHRFPWASWQGIGGVMVIGVLVAVITWLLGRILPIKPGSVLAILAFFFCVVPLGVWLERRNRYAPRGWIVITTQRVLYVYEGGVLSAEGDMIEGVRFDCSSRPQTVTVEAPYIDASGADFSSLVLFPKGPAEPIAREIAARFTPGRPATRSPGGTRAAELL